MIANFVIDKRIGTLAMIGIGILFLVFNNIIFNLLHLSGNANYWDELLFFVLIILFILIALYKGKVRLCHESIKILSCTFGIIVIGLLGNLVYDYAASFQAIFRDIVGFSKFPISLVIMQNICNDGRKLVFQIEKIVIPVIKIVVLIMFVLGIISLFVDIGLSQNEIRHGFMPYQFLFTHPTYLVQTCVLLLAIFSVDSYIRGKSFYQIMLLIIIALTARSKGYAFIAVFLILRFARDWLKKHTIVLIALATLVSFIAAYDMLELYASYSSSPREALYMGAFQLAVQCFPFGSGFATFGSHLSARIEFRSAVYRFIYIPAVFVNNIANAGIGDTGYPYYIGQFGLLGFVVFLMMLFTLFKSRAHLSQQIILFYILIALTSENILVGSGVELAILLYCIDLMNTAKDFSCQKKAQAMELMQSH